MRPLMWVWLVILFSSAAQAQPLYSLQDMINAATHQCIVEHAGQQDAPRFCTCWVNHWVGLWDDNDRVTWTRTGVATPHMQEMEKRAAHDCGG